LNPGKSRLARHLRSDALVRIEHGGHHDIRNIVKALIKTLNFSANDLSAAKP
jgi:hypothetical protein